jgi:hypothetical protein
VRNQIQTAHGAHVNVADNQVEGAVFQHIDRVFTRRCKNAFVVFSQQRFEQGPDLLVVVNNQDGRFWYCSNHY